MTPVDVDGYAALDALATTQEITQRMHDALERLEEWIGRRETPAQLKTIVLEPSKRGLARDDVGHASLSIGLLNPTAITIYLGIGGGSASASARAVSVPPRTLMVLPVAVEDLEIGANVADLGGNDAVVFLLRFKSVQQAYMHTI